LSLEDPPRFQAGEAALRRYGDSWFTTAQGDPGSVPVAPPRPAVVDRLGPEGGAARSAARVAWPPALLLGADFLYGTLAATRSLGRAGIRVAVADPRRSAAACWSRYASRRLCCPNDPVACIDWLLDFGKRNGKHVLFPTDDNTAWLLARYQEDLSPYLYLHQPPVQSVYNVINKWRLFEYCSSSGLRSPRTWQPKSAADLREIADTARFPLLIKPSTQALFFSRCKGSRADTPQDLMRLHGLFQAHPYADCMTQFDPAVTLSIVQEYYPDATASIYGLSGFMDNTGRCLVARANPKVLQRPRQLGVGLCFESADVRADLVHGLETMCRRSGYYGIFEAEFVNTVDGLSLIDFNPRLYNQLAMDTERGAELPLMVYYAALGETQRVKDLGAGACSHAETGSAAYAHRFLFEVMLRAQGLSGALHRREVAHWRDWLAKHRSSYTDAVRSMDDPLPGVVDTMRHLLHFARHPRAFVRSFWRNQ
jgi:predicted ATP-grasp superfamily ATP-dependent carboligase